MKLFKWMAKMVLWLSALLAAACAVIAYWDVIERAIYRVRESLFSCCAKKETAAVVEDEFADWED